MRWENPKKINETGSIGQYSAFWSLVSLINAQRHFDMLTGGKEGMVVAHWPPNLTLLEISEY
jgi:hypothetical protein